MAAMYLRFGLFWLVLRNGYPKEFEKLTLFSTCLGHIAGFVKRGTQKLVGFELDPMFYQDILGYLF